VVFCGDTIPLISNIIWNESELPILHITPTYQQPERLNWTCDTFWYLDFPSSAKLKTTAISPELNQWEKAWNISNILQPILLI